MRRVSTQATAIVGYLGRLSGVGSLKIGGKTVARATYDFDGFAMPHGGVTGSGELRLAAPDLEVVFGRIGVQLLTDDGRLLDLKFSEKELPAGTDAAHVDVSGDLPRSPAEWRVGSTRELIRSQQGPKPPQADAGIQLPPRRAGSPHSAQSDAPHRRYLVTVSRDNRRSRAIARTHFPLACSRRTRAIVSTVSAPEHLRCRNRR